ncbi:MAG: restriction endonuclease subunit [Bacillales bacterium]|jgi:type I restriction enzyme S subunit|nr:restriction endonuclease subunit [Bacillales bacterium]
MKFNKPNFKIDTLGNCISKVIDYRGKTPKKMGGNWVNSGVKVISAKNVNGGKIVNETAIRFVEYNVYKKWMKEDIEREDVLLVSEGATLGESLMWDIDERVVLGQRLFCIRTDKKILYPRYFAAIIPTTFYQGEIIGRSTGTSVLGLRQPELLNTRVLLPPMEEQIYIGDLYYNLNKKIELNKEMIISLEEMANVIFKHWLVDFEFPNEFDEPYKSSGGKLIKSELGMIPEEWEVLSGEEVFSCFSGYSYKGKELGSSVNAMVTIKNFDRSGGFKVDGFKEIHISDRVKAHHYVQMGDVVVAHTDLTQGAEIIGNPILINTHNGYKNLIISMDTVKVTSRDGNLSNNLIYLILKDNRFKNYALGWTNGTTVLHLSKKAIATYKIALPKDKPLLKKLQNVLEPLFNLCSLKYNENITLLEIRDKLLPKLILGQIRIKEVEREVEECLQKSN